MFYALAKCYMHGAGENVYLFKFDADFSDIMLAYEQWQDSTDPNVEHISVGWLEFLRSRCLKALVPQAGRRAVWVSEIFTVDQPYLSDLADLGRYAVIEGDLE